MELCFESLKNAPFILTANKSKIIKCFYYNKYLINFLLYFKN